MNPSVDIYFNKSTQWQGILRELRSILLECGLTEEWKWRAPCYTFQQKNIIILYGFKESCGLGFFKGSLLNDTHNILQKPGENTQAGRIIRFTDIQELVKIEFQVKEYIYKAIEIEKSGLKPIIKKTIGDIPEEFQQKLDDTPLLKESFEALTEGRKRGYILYFSGSKQSQSRKARIEKYIPRILKGKGLHDCVCGLSKKYPVCDGSHAHIPQENFTVTDGITIQIY